MEDSDLLHFLFLWQNFDYVVVASIVWLVYDHMLTIGDEIRFVWPSPWRLGKVLFIVTRYLPFVSIPLTVYRGAESISTNTCHTLSAVGGFLLFGGLVIAEAIMALRVWAMWNQSRMVGFCLAPLAIIMVAVNAIILIKFSENYHYTDLTDIITPVPPGCFLLDSSNIEFVSFLLLMGFEFLMLALTVFKGIQDLKDLNRTCFLYKFYRDGTLPSPEEPE
ncbi:hypothetical protein ONZ45_g9287 [Pleurotus djamor]|nr:hypothetical protein ONZ45_g9287 [Pleurotus djamor]